MFALPVLIRRLMLQLSSPSLIFYALKQTLHTCSSPDILNRTRAIERTLTPPLCLEFLPPPQAWGGVFTGGFKQSLCRIIRVNDDGGGGLNTQNNEIMILNLVLTLVVVFVVGANGLRFITQ